ncbi:MAG: restriction endonuclease [Dehalococcoidia bacterium]|nr:restriction endonuclease [Dehalococcoidia bacterium]
MFRVSQREEFLAKIGVITPPRPPMYDPYQTVLERILELDPSEFEILIEHLLTALGFEGTEVTGKPGDGGVDVIGELNVSNLASVSIYVQAKRHKLGSKVSRNDVMKLRQMIPFGGQGAVITTADYHHAAPDIAFEQGFPRIGLINGQQLVDLLTEHWTSIPLEFQERLGLKPGLVWQR